jgi:hypothetical protein
MDWGGVVQDKTNRKRRNEMSKKMYVCFILDETGSMNEVKAATISGFNEYIEGLKADETASGVLFSLTKFNSNKHEIVYSNVPLSFVAKLSDRNYRPESMTPLYDAIGKTIASMSGLEGKKQHVLFIIQTDGLENDSKEYTQKHIFDLIKEKKEKGWTFVFLGADQDAYAASSKIGISYGNTMSYDSVNTKDTIAYAAVNLTRSYTSTGGAQSESLVTTEDSTDKKEGKK